MIFTYVEWFIQIGIVGFIVYFVTGRLMGAQVNFIRKVISVAASVILTSVVYWYTYLRFTNFSDESTLHIAMDPSALLWVGCMLLLSMLFYLISELVDPLQLNGSVDNTQQKSWWRRIRNHWRHQKRLRYILKMAVTNGLSRTIKYARQPESQRELAIGLRDTLEKSGGMFIKFGQVLSTRKELFSPVFIDELEKLQHNVDPLAPEKVHHILYNELPYDVSSVFSYIDPTPLAAASIGQVHKAVLHNGERVIIKLLRPEVKEVLRDDLGLLVDFSTWLTNKSAWAESLSFRELAHGFAETIREEMDFSLEVRNMMQMGKSLENNIYHIHVPKVYPQYSAHNILVMEYIDGESVSDAANIFSAHGTNRKDFARDILYSFFEQLLFAGIFHADPHPGNIHVEHASGEPVLLDFGSVGRLAVQQQEGLKLFFMGVQQEDADILFDGIVLLVDDIDITKREEMEQSISQVLMRISYLDNIPAEELVGMIFEVVRHYGLKFRSSVAAALRSLVTLEGTLHVIDPTFDFFDEAKAFSAEYMRASITKPFREPMETKKRLEEEFSTLLPQLRKLPRRLDRLVQLVEAGKVTLHHDLFSDPTSANFVRMLFSRIILLAVGVTFGIISVALLAIAQFIDEMYAVYLNTASYMGLFLCAILLVRVSVQALRDEKDTK